MGEGAIALDRVPARLGWTASGLFLLLALFALTVPIDHDEGQYLAATRLVAEGWRPYLDFPYLQTPLQPYLMAPLQWLAPGWLLIASRLANALAVALAAWLVGRAAARMSGNAWSGPLAALLLVLCDSVLFAGSVARNDALPLLLLALGLERLWTAADAGRNRLFIAGVALAAAASAKISYALPAAAVALVGIARGRSRPNDLFALLGGMLLGAAPSLAFLAAAPERVYFYVVEYSTDGVRAFRALSGSEEMLGWPNRAARLLKFAAMGPLLAMLGYAASRTFRGPGRAVQQWPLGISPGPVLLAAILAAILPMPVYRQYLVPVVVPLILWLAADGALDRILERRRPALTGVLALLAVAGLWRSVHDLLTTSTEHRPLAVEVQAHNIGQIAAASGAGTIAGLDMVRATDSGLALDRRLAPGPFLFRAGNLAECRETRLCGVTFADLSPIDRQPPDAIVSGSERKAIGPLRTGLDGAIEGWARANDYRPVAIGPATLWLRSP